MESRCRHDVAKWGLFPVSTTKNYYLWTYKLYFKKKEKYVWEACTVVNILNRKKKKKFTNELELRLKKKDLQEERKYSRKGREFLIYHPKIIWCPICHWKIVNSLSTIHFNFFPSSGTTVPFCHNPSNSVAIWAIWAVPAFTDCLRCPCEGNTSETPSSYARATSTLSRSHLLSTQQLPPPNPRSTESKSSKHEGMGTGIHVSWWQ